MKVFKYAAGNPTLSRGWQTAVTMHVLPLAGGANANTGLISCSLAARETGAKADAMQVFVYSDAGGLPKKQHFCWKVPRFRPSRYGRLRAVFLNLCETAARSIRFSFDEGPVPTDLLVNTFPFFKVHTLN